MAIGRISGSVLKSNLTRNGTDLAFETTLLYLDVTNSRIGIGTSSPATTLDVSGTITATTVTATNLTVGGATPIIGKKEGTNFNESLLVGHSTTGTLDAAQWNVGVGIEALDAITGAGFIAKKATDDDHEEIIRELDKLQTIKGGESKRYSRAKK